MVSFGNKVRPLALLFVALGVAACGGGGPAVADVSAEEALSRAAQRFESVKSFHFKLDHDNGATQIVFGLGLDVAEGDFVLPDRMSGEVNGRFAGQSVTVKVVAIGDRTWITNPFSREFQRAPGSILDVIDPAALVAAVAKSIRDARIDGSETIDGIDTYRLKGTILSDDLRDGLSFGDTGRTLDVEIWVGKDDYLVRRAKLKGPLLPDESDNITRDLTLSKFDAPVTIEEPR